MLRALNGSLFAFKIDRKTKADRTDEKSVEIQLL